MHPHTRAGAGRGMARSGAPRHGTIENSRCLPARMSQDCHAAAEGRVKPAPSLTGLPGQRGHSIYRVAVISLPPCASFNIVGALRRIRGSLLRTVARCSGVLSRLVHALVGGDRRNQVAGKTYGHTDPDQLGQGAIVACVNTPQRLAAGCGVMSCRSLTRPRDVARSRRAGARERPRRHWRR
jgi:hypothetical protein